MTRRKLFRLLAGLPLVGLLASKVSADVHGDEAKTWARMSRKALASENPYTHTCNCTNTVQITDIVCPCKASLDRRYEATNNQWQNDWLADETDPCEVCKAEITRHHWRCDKCGTELWWSGP